MSRVTLRAFFQFDVLRAQNMLCPIYAVAFKLLLLSCLCAASLLAQSATGDILGTVTDASGAIVSGASVRIENTGTREVRTLTTGSSGGYTFSSLQPGTYRLSILSSGFKTYESTQVVVAASDRVRIDANLQPGSVEERVEVSSVATSLQTDSTTVGSTITEKTLVDAPLNGRNYVGLVQVQAGVNAGSANSLSSGAQQTDRRQSSSVSANGQEEIFNNNQVDGLDNNSRATGSPLLRPSVEAIAEVRTDINLYTAEVGRTGGAAINVITKSGTNALHGSAYEFFRNDITDARNFFASGIRKPELRQNQFGGSLSGSLLRDKTFFFVDYEGLRRIDGNNSVYVSTVPTATERANPGTFDGAISGINGAPGSGLVAGKPIPVIPTSAIDPTALGYFSLFPFPNAGTQTSNNYLYNPSASLYQSLGDLRIDHHFSASDTLFGRYSYNRTTAFTPSALPSVNGASAGGVLSGTLPGNNLTTTHNGQFGYTHIFTPQLLLDLRTGYTYFNLASTPANYGQNLNDSAPYLIPNANECISCSGLATVNIVGFSALGDSIAQPAVNIDHVTQFAGSLTYTHGRNTFKAGSALIRRNFSFQLPIYAKGLVTFASASPSLSLYNFFRGAPYIANRAAFIVKPYDRSWEPSAYFQDDWRATSHLTLNLGLRYDVYTKPNEKYGNNANYDLSTFTLINNATGGVKNVYYDFSPRFGFDATIASGTVLRGGFGLTFYPGDANNGLVLNNAPVGFNSGSVQVSTSLSQTGVPAVTVQPTANTSLFGTVTAKPLNHPDSYLEQMNLLLQKESHGYVFTVGYVGELGRHIINQIANLNIPSPSGTSVLPSLLYAAQLPKVSTINYYGYFGASSYNSMQVSVERRVSRGLTANFNYTWAHNLDDVVQVFDGDGTSNAFALLPSKISTYDYGNSPLDLKSRFAGVFSYDIPLGKTGTSFYKAAVGGFHLNGLGFWQTGSPYKVTSAATPLNGVATINLPTVTVDRPNVAGPYSVTNAVGSGATAFNINAFAQQAEGTAGNEGRNQLFGPHLRRGDLSIFKTIPIKGVALELRAECFNVTNTPNFALPNSRIAGYLGSPNTLGGNRPSPAGGFGTISSTLFGYSGRQYQFAGRFIF